jgi:hypothetical protein
MTSTKQNKTKQKLETIERKQRRLQKLERSPMPID